MTLPGPNVEGPIHWPSLLPDEAAEQWEELRAWVDLLVARFGLDARVVPPCWYRHNRIVEALSALRDHEHACFNEQSSPAAATDWLRTLRDIEHYLTESTARTGCTANEHHDDPARNTPTRMTDWREHVDSDTNRREQLLIEASVNHL